MPSEVISLPDYLHAIQVVLDRVTRACPDRRSAEACGQARIILAQVDATRLRIGISAVEQSRIERLSGQALPTRVMAWLAECSQRISARDFTCLAADLLALCRALDKSVRAQLPCAHGRPTPRVPGLRRAGVAAPAYQRYPPSRSQRSGQPWRRVDELAVRRLVINDLIP